MKYCNECYEEIKEDEEYYECCSCDAAYHVGCNSSCCNTCQGPLKLKK